MRLFFWLACLCVSFAELTAAQSCPAIDPADPDRDTDGDGIPDLVEGDPALPLDLDEDGLPNHCDLDSDGDAISDADEAGPDPLSPRDTDLNSLPDFLDVDSDDDGLPDVIEAGDLALETPPIDSDGDGLPDYLDLDSDEDGLLDQEERGEPWGILLRDTDRDGVPDYLDLDSDDDGYADATELDRDEFGAPGDRDGDGLPNYRDGDQDGDGVDDRIDNCLTVPNPDQADADGSGDGDACSDDDDGDGILDAEDNCVSVFNPDQRDENGDGVGDLCSQRFGDAADDAAGCAASGSTGAQGLWLGILLLGIAAWRRRALATKASASLIALALFVDAGAAHAQEVRSFSVERFQPASDRLGILGVEYPEIGPHLAGQAAILLGYSHRPLAARSGDDVLFGLVDHRVHASVVGVLPLFEVLSLGVELPFVMVQLRDEEGLAGFADPLPRITSAGLGDLRIIPKVQLLRSGDHKISLALIPSFTIPLGEADDYLRERSATFAPQLSLGRAFGPLRFALNLGYRMRSRSEAQGLSVDDEIFGALGVALDLQTLGVPLEIDLSADLNFSAIDPFARASETGSEVRLGVLYDLGNVAPFVAAGVGLTSGYAVPGYRILVGARMGRLHPEAQEPEPPAEAPQDDAGDHDSDGDQIPDAIDPCPHEPGPGGCPAGDDAQLWEPAR